MPTGPQGQKRDRKNKLTVGALIAALFPVVWLGKAIAPGWNAWLNTLPLSVKAPLLVCSVMGFLAALTGLAMYIVSRNTDA